MIDELAETAKRLREVREARQLFLALWTLDAIADQPELLDRVHGDVERLGKGPRLETPLGALAQMNKPWSHLQRGELPDD